MRLMSAAAKFLVMLLFAGLTAFAQGTYKVEPVPLPSASDLPQALAATLDPNGVRMVDEQAAVVGELWLRKSIPVSASAGGYPDVIYGGLSAGTFVGVLHFPAQGSDFRGQKIPAGYYTLRYALMPSDGNHMGVSTYRDFLKMCPAAADTRLDQVLGYDAMVNLSRKASGTGHPAILSLDPAIDAKTLPAAVHDDQGNWAAQVLLHGKSGDAGKDFPMAIILVGKTTATE